MSIMRDGPTPAAPASVSGRRYLREKERIHIADQLREKASLRTIGTDLVRPHPRTPGRRRRRAEQPPTQNARLGNPSRASRQTPDDSQLIAVLPRPSRFARPGVRGLSWRGTRPAGVRSLVDKHWRVTMGTSDFRQALAATALQVQGCLSGAHRRAGHRLPQRADGRPRLVDRIAAGNLGQGVFPALPDRPRFA